MIPPPPSLGAFLMNPKRNTRTTCVEILDGHVVTHLRGTCSVRSYNFCPRTRRYVGGDDSVYWNPFKELKGNGGKGVDISVS